MHGTKGFRRTAAACVLLLALGLGWVWAATFNSNSPQPSLPPQSLASPVPRAATPQRISTPLQAYHLGEPRLLRILALGIEAPVSHVGLNDNGEMAAPDNREGVVWYKFGYVPGALGNAVMAGHSTHKTGKGVFYDLKKLRAGDKIEVHGPETALTFVVRSIEKYVADNNRHEELFGPSTTANLNLITCSGTWSTAAQRYDGRLVVRAQFEKEVLRTAMQE